MEAQPEHNIPGVRPLPNTPSDVSCSSGPCSAVSTRETSPASSTYHHPLEVSSASRDSFILCPDQAAAAIPSAGPDQSSLLHNSCRPLPGLEVTIPSPLEMNPLPFQSVSGGSRSNSSSSSSNNKLAAEDLRLSHASSGATPDDRNLCHRLPSNQQQQQHLQFRQVLAPTPSQQQHLQSIPPPSASIHRLVRTPNWRSSAVSLDNLTSSPSPINTLTEPPSSCPPRDTPTRDFATASSPPFLRSPVSNFDPRSSNSSNNGSNLLAHTTTYVPIAGPGFSRKTSFSSSTHQYRDKQHHHHPFETHPHPFNSNSNIAATTVNMRPQNGKLIADSAMDRSMAYCYDRGGGEYTRLVPVDLLPVDLESIPRRVNTDEGMIVLPVPRQPGADGQPADAQLERQRVVTPPSSPIIGNGNGNGFATTDSIQSRIDSIIGASPGPGAGPLVLAKRGLDGSTPTRAQPTSGGGGGSSGRREKIYCDKWIHDGTCAFTQQGCKYKHEMPHDRETQEKLGLFHGYPSWWKKQALENQRPLAIDDRPVPLGSSGRPVFPALTGSTSVGSGISNAVVSSNWRAGSGPVAGDAGCVQRSPPSPTPLGSGGGVNRSIGFGGAGRGSGRQVRTFASFQPPTYGPIAPPSRAAAAANGSATATAGAAAPAPVPTTRNTRSLTASSLFTSTTNGTGGGAPYGGTQRSIFESGNPFAPLGEIVQQASGRTPVVRREDTESSSGDNTAGDGEQRGAPL